MTEPASVAAKAATLRRLELQVTRRLDGMLTGDYLAVAAGPGTERSGARPYEPGDDARRMDWNLTARALTPHVRTTDADTEMETWVVADRSASLDFGTAQCEKRDLVLAAAAAFGFLTARHGNRLGLLIGGGDDLMRVPARSGRVSMMAALSSLYESPRTHRGPGPKADLAATLDSLNRSKRQRGQVVVVSDFLDGSDWRTSVSRLALRHQVVGVQVTDPRELRLPDIGILGVIDPETGRRLHVQTNSAALRTRFEAAAAERHQRIRADLVSAGAEHLHLSTDRDWLIDFARFVAIRGALRGSRVRVWAGR
ncbi:MAG: DUF58 domain-containing protein [Acidimicrobiales bacterium]|nr:DUF58 domain-containing protein [Acidimicrobiales bacterium]